MEWLERMNHAMTYIEEHLCEEMDYRVFGRILCCSASEFSRIFAFAAGIPISEYIRRRRLSMAALEIQRDHGKIIDVAMKYGYESQAAFSRAFKAMHGITPMAARNAGSCFKTYPKVFFSFSVKGVQEMNFRIEKTQRCYLVDADVTADMTSGVNLTPNCCRVWSRRAE